MKKNLFLLLAGAALMALTMFVYHECFEKKLAYIDIPKVFNGFSMKTEMQEKFKKTAAMRQRVIDSLSVELQLLAKKLRTKQNDRELSFEFDSKREFFFKKQRETEEDNKALSDQYDQQILGQMSQYMLDYGKENGYDVILGADGHGALMYANEMLNVTDEVTTFINEKYNGTK